MNENLENNKRILTLCMNSEFYMHQKIDLILRAIQKNDENHKTYDHMFICTGNVRIEENESDISSDFLYHYETRKKFFKYSAEQRQMISEELSDANIENLTLFSIVFDLFNSNHQTDIKKFKCIDLEQMELDDRVKLGEQSSFILYNCARISAILEKFNSFVKQGRHSKAS